MSAEVFAATRVAQLPLKEPRIEVLTPVRQREGWSRESFAREQVRGLVRRLFSPARVSRVRQVVFAAIETETDVNDVCRRVGETLAGETNGSVAVIGEFRTARSSDLSSKVGTDKTQKEQIGSLKCSAGHSKSNLWLLAGDADKEGDSGESQHRYLNEIRNQFGYSVIAAPAIAVSDRAIALSQWADGVVLVLSARRTRRATACKAKELLQQAEVHILGTVLIEREFPVPQAIYQRL